MSHVLRLKFVNPQEGMLLPPVVEARYTDFTPRFTQSFLPQVILFLVFTSSQILSPKCPTISSNHNLDAVKEQPAQFHNLFHSLRTWLPTHSKYVKVHN